MILRWAGSKSKAASSICRELDFTKDRLIEPFCGTGIVSITSMLFKEYWLNDANPDLINFYKYLGKLELPTTISKDKFRNKREAFNNSSRKGKKAAQLFWDLNRSCHRGLMNYSSCGRLVTSFGATAVTIPKSSLDSFKRLICKPYTQITCSDYKRVIRKAGSTDCVYIDPPYYDSTSRYNADYFGPDQQAELTIEVEKAANRGATVLVSNYDLPFTRFLYRSADKIITPKGSSQNLKKGNKELLAKWN